MLFSDFKIYVLRIIRTPPMEALTEISNANYETSIQPLLVSRYSNFTLLCSCTHMRSILCSTANAVSTGSWFILFKVILSKVAMIKCFCIKVLWVWDLLLIIRTLGPTSTCCIVICWFMQKYTYICWIHTDAMNNRRKDKDALNDKNAGRLLYKKYLPLTLFVRFERVVQGLYVRGSWR